MDSLYAVVSYILQMIHITYVLHMHPRDPRKSLEYFYLPMLRGSYPPPPPNFGWSVKPVSTRRGEWQILPTILLFAPLDFQNFLRPCLSTYMRSNGFLEEKKNIVKMNESHFSRMMLKYVKFIYSEKATKCKISTNYLTGST